MDLFIFHKNTQCLLLFLILIDLTFTQASDQDNEKSHESQIPQPYQQPSPDEIKMELSRLFVNNDKDSNKFLTLEEISHWIEKVHEEVIKENIERQWYYYEPHIQEVHSWQGYKPEEKEVLIWEKYKNKTYPDELMKENEQFNDHFKNLKSLLERSKKRWQLADINNDTILIKEEFKDFMHPEESSRSEVKQIIIDEAIEDMDKNGNGLISLEEYMLHISEMAQDDEKNDQEWVQVQQNHFATYLDKNKDGALDKDELRDWLIPSYNRHKMEASRLISIADKNKDDILSDQEIHDNFSEFFSLIPPDFWSKYMPDESLYQSNDKHDEL